MIDKLIKLVQKAKTIAIVQVRGGRTATKKLNRQRMLLEFFGKNVEWYYFESTISACDLIFEIENLKPFVDEIIVYPSDAITQQQIKDYNKELENWKEERHRIVQEYKERQKE